MYSISAANVFYNQFFYTDVFCLNWIGFDFWIEGRAVENLVGSRLCP